MLRAKYPPGHHRADRAGPGPSRVGIYAQGLKDILGENPQPLVNVARDPHPQCSAELEREFVRALYGLLKPVHDHNTRTTDWKAQKTLQAYTYDTYERDRLTDVLIRRVADPEAPRLPFRSLPLAALS